MMRRKKRHTVKNQLVVHPRNTRILTVSLTVEGKRHDKKLLETIKTELQDAQILVRSRDFRTALDLIITVKGEIKDNKTFALEVKAEDIPNSEPQ